MRFNRTLAIAITLTVLAIGIVAAPAVAGQRTLPQLKQQLRLAEQLRQRARERARVAAMSVAGARELYALTGTTGGLTAPEPTATPSPDPTASPTPEPTATPSPEPGVTALVLPAGMSQTLAARLLADGIVTADEVSALQTRLAASRTLAHRWAVKARTLHRQVRHLAQIRGWNRSGQWKPLIEIAGRKYGVSPAGLYRMMMLESGGRRSAGSRYKGLYQYYPGTWYGDWNPWRHESIYDGWAQIRATAYALGRGMGPSQWPYTYPMAF